MSGILTYTLCFCALALLFCFLPKEKRTKRTALALLIVSLVFELTVANFHSYHLWFGDYEPATLALQGESVSITGGSADRLDPTAVTNQKGTSMTLEFRDIDRPVGTLHLHLDLGANTTYADVKIDAKDVTQSASYRGGVADGRVIAGDSRSAYIVLDLSGDVSDLRVKITPSKDGTVTLRQAEVNRSVPLHMSALRLMLLVLGGMAVCFLCTSPSMKATYGENRRALRYAVLGMTAVFIIGAVLVTWVSMYDQGGGISEGFKNTRGNQITQEIVDAFRAGQVHLLDTPSKELLEMENPYDWSARRDLGVPAKWDHLLFDGKYYSYYGIAPVLLLFLPYNLLTGYYFPTAEAVLLFGALGILFLSLLFLEFAELFCKKIPNSMLVSTLLILLISCGVWYNFVYDNFYEIAQASGFCFTCAGFYFLLRSRIIGEGRIRYRHMAWAAVCLSLAVLCRPTLALYCFVACIFIGFGFCKHRREIRDDFAETERIRSAPSRSKHTGSDACKAKRAMAGSPDSIPSQAIDALPYALKAGSVKYLLAALLPFVLIGSVQMAYNYARFGSVLDFGIQYSLTINDFTRSQYHTDFVMIGIYNFIFAFPSIRPEFPYVLSNFSTLSANGYYYVANRNAVGILWRALPSLGYLGIKPAWKSMTRKERVQALCLLIPTCVIAPLIIIFSIWESGYGVRYCCDFAWQIILGGAAVLYLLYVRAADGQGKHILRHAFTIAAVLAVIVNGAMIYDYLSKTGHLAADYLRFGRVFDFWL